MTEMRLSCRLTYMAGAMRAKARMKATKDFMIGTGRCLEEVLRLSVICRMAFSAFIGSSGPYFHCSCGWDAETRTAKKI